MAEFCVRIEDMERAAEGLRGYGQTIRDLRSSLVQIRSGIQLKGEAGEALLGQLSQIAHVMAGQASSSFQLSTALLQSMDAYRTAERRILEGGAAAGAGNGQGGAGWTDILTASDVPSNGQEWDPEVFEFISSMVGELGIVGSTASTVANWFINGATGKDQLTGAGKDLSKVLQDLTKVDTLFKGAEKEAGIIGKIGKGFGAFFTGLSNFGENYDEFGGVTTRGVAETVTETVLDTAVGWALPVVGTAAATAVGAPVIAGVAIVTGIWWGIDTLVEHVTGNDMTELVSDFVLDVGECIIAAGETISTAWDGLCSGVSDWWDSLWD